MTKLSQHQERRRHPRFLLDLPLDHRILGSPSPYGGIAIDGSETGLLIHTFQDMPVGTELNVAVLFADEFELACFDAMTKIVRKVCSGNRQRGYGYGLRIDRINEMNVRQLRRLLRTCALTHSEITHPLPEHSAFFVPAQVDKRRRFLF